jgi:hypothetical protein
VGPDFGDAGEPLLGVDVTPALVTDRSFGQAGVLVPAAVEVVDVPVGARGEDDLGHRVGELAEVRFGFEDAVPSRRVDPFPVIADVGQSG